MTDSKVCCEHGIPCTVQVKFKNQEHLVNSQEIEKYKPETFFLFDFLKVKKTV